MVEPSATLRLLPERKTPNPVVVNEVICRLTRKFPVDSIRARSVALKEVH
jgi:hypothetical protein